MRKEKKMCEKEMIPKITFFFIFLYPVLPYLLFPLFFDSILLPPLHEFTKKQNIFWRRREKEEEKKVKIFHDLVSISSDFSVCVEYSFEDNKKIFGVFLHLWRQSKQSLYVSEILIFYCVTHNLKLFFSIWHIRFYGYVLTENI